MKTRKVISAVLAGACALSALSFSATAADKEIKAAGATTFKVSAGLVVPALSVTIPSAVSAVINPYGVAVTDSKGVEYGAEGVTSAVYTIVNKTTACAVSVQGTASLTVPITGKKSGSGESITDDRAPTIKVVEDPTTIDDKTEVKTLCAYVLATAKTDITSDEATAYAYAKVDGSLDAKGNLVCKMSESEDLTKVNLITPTKGDDPTPVKFEAGKTLVFADATTYKDHEDTAKYLNDGELMVIPPAALPTKSGDAYKAGSGKWYYGQFQLGGVVTPNAQLPAGGKWGTTDKLTLNLVLDIQPAADPTAETE